MRREIRKWLRNEEVDKREIRKWIRNEKRNKEVDEK